MLFLDLYQLVPGIETGGCLDGLPRQVINNIAAPCHDEQLPLEPASIRFAPNTEDARDTIPSQSPSCTVRPAPT